MHTDSYKISCLIVDDEPLAQDVIASHIKQVDALELVDRCSNAMEAFEALHKNNIDLIFLDINMPVVSGLNFLKSLKDPPAVILTTAYTEYALEGYELDVIDYLLKPVSFNRFLKSVKKVIQHLSNKGHSVVLPAQEEFNIAPSTSSAEKNYFFVKADGKLVKINYADIRYIEGMKDYLKIHTLQQMIVTHHTMKAMEEQLPKDKFMRVHKSFIVALNAIKAIDGSIIHLDMNKVEIPLGNSFKENVLKAIAGS